MDSEFDEEEETVSRWLLGILVEVEDFIDLIRRCLGKNVLEPLLPWYVRLKEEIRKRDCYLAHLCYRYVLEEIQGILKQSKHCPG